MYATQRQTLKMPLLKSEKKEKGCKYARNDEN
jgi:hypothetical protein